MFAWHHTPLIIRSRGLINIPIFTLRVTHVTILVLQLTRCLWLFSKRKKRKSIVVEVYCTAALHNVMATAQPVWNASVLLGRRKGYLCFLHIAVTQTRSFKLFCPLDGLHNSLPNLHNNKLKKKRGGVRKSTCSWTSRGLEPKDLDAGAGAQCLFSSGRLKRHKNASIQNV